MNWRNTGKWALLKKYFGFTFLLCLVLSCKDKSGTKTTEPHRNTNSLIHETSPYLLQHAHNPVAWKAWSQDALDEAKQKNKLVLVSIGYSSCHWCHVMEEETFENDSVAEIMNVNFVNIKVDREERPDVDLIYQTFAELTSSNTGWPLNIIALPNGKPLYGGTYHTKEQWTKAITEISKMYHNDPEKAKQYSDMVTQGIQEVNIVSPSKDFEILNKEVLQKGITSWKDSWDNEWGGIKGQEKFMAPVSLDFLMDYAVLLKDQNILDYLELTLDKMAMGGLYDHVGGGFFRYSTDSFWKVPHFEKMLYDNAQALSLYTKAYTIFKKERYREVCFGIFDFLEREMKNPEGGYFAALDADSEGEEGKYYVWTKEELATVLGSEFQLFASYYNIREEAVWEEEKYVLHQLKDDLAFLNSTGISQDKLTKKKKEWTNTLLQSRSNRVKPRIDDKIITSWNALLINGYTDMYATFGNEEALAQAISIVDFIKEKSYSNKNLRHSYKKDSKRIESFLEDYTFLANAALHLYSVSMQTDYLMFADELTEIARNSFHDEDSGLYSYNKENTLIAKLIKTQDGGTTPIPSPNSVMAHNLFQLGHITYDPKKTKKSKEMLSTVLPLLEESTYAFSKWSSLLTHVTYPYYEVAIVGANAKNFLKDFGKIYIPNTLFVGSTTASDLPLFEGRYDASDTFIYVCRDNSCKLPVNNIRAALNILVPDTKSTISPVPDLGI